MDMVPAAVAQEIAAQRDWTLARAAGMAGELGRLTEEIQRLKASEDTLRKQLAEVSAETDPTP